MRSPDPGLPPWLRRAARALRQRAAAWRVVVESTAAVAARTAPGLVDRTAAAAVGTAPVAAGTAPVGRDTAAEAGVPRTAARTAAAAARTARAAAARTDWPDSARKAAAARSYSCRQDIGPTHPRPSRVWGGLAELSHLHGDEHLRTAPGVGAAQRGDVAIVAAVADADVPVG